MTRYKVTERWGTAYRNTNNTRWGGSETRELAESTVRKLVREVRQWANGTYDSFTDQTYPNCVGVDCKQPGHQARRVVIAHHYVTGVDNVRQLTIEAVAP